MSFVLELMFRNINSGAFVSFCGEPSGAEQGMDRSGAEQGVEQVKKEAEQSKAWSRLRRKRK